MTEYWYTPGRFPVTTSVLTYTLSINLSATSLKEMEMVNEGLFVMAAPFLVQLYSVGGPPLVSPIRVKVGGSLRNEEEERETWLDVTTPESRYHS